MLFANKILSEIIFGQSYPRHFRADNFGDNFSEQHRVHFHQSDGGDHLQVGQRPEPGVKVPSKKSIKNLL